MVWKIYRSLYVVFVCFMLASPIYAQTLSVTPLPDSEVLVSLARKYINHSNTDTEASFVNIRAVDAGHIQSHNGKLSSGKAERYGQGIVIDAQGIIVTNKHVVGNSPQHIYVMLHNGQILEAKKLRSSKTDDLCLLKITTDHSLNAIAMGDATNIQIGSRVLAFANGTLENETAKRGKIIEVYKDATTDKVAILKMNIPLKEGDSGGPVLNEDGLLLGLIMANQVSDPTKSYAIAANKIMQEYYTYRNSILN